jgi:hypothetical protein
MVTLEKRADNFGPRARMGTRYKTLLENCVTE